MITLNSFCYMPMSSKTLFLAPILVLFSMSLITGCASSINTTDPAAGDWTFTIDSPMGFMEGLLTLEQSKDGAWSGFIKIDDQEIVLSAIERLEYQLSFNVNTSMGGDSKIRLTLNQAAFEGIWHNIDNDIEMPMKGKKS